MARYCTLTIILSLLLLPVCRGQNLSFSERGVGGGGALFFPKINPANPDEFYIACDMSQLFRSQDFGNTYSQVHFSKLAAMNVSTYEWTNDANIAYCYHSDGNDGYPVKTTDGGANWLPLPGFNSGSGMVYRMAANYNNPQQLLMNYYDEIVISNNGGTTFQTVATASNSGSGLVMGGVFYNGNNIYIGTNDGLYVSTNGGLSFSVMSTTGIPANQGIWHFSGAAVGGNTRFVCIVADEADIYNGLQPYEYWGFPKGIYVMDNANGTWTPASTGINLNTEFVMYTGMAWNDINTIYLGGSDNGTPLVYKSTNGGGSWAKVFNTSGNQNIATGWSGQGGDKGWSWGEATFGLAVAPNNSNRVVFGDFGFVHVTSNGGANWKQAYVSQGSQHPEGAATPTQQLYTSIGLENTTCWQVFWTSPTSLMAAYSDIGAIRSPNGGASWGFTQNGLSVNSTYRIVKNPAGTLFAGTSAIHDMYQSTRLADNPLNNNDPQGKISYSTDNGANWILLHQFNHPVFWLAIDPNNAERMYASVVHSDTAIGGIYRTDNLGMLGGSTWTKLPAPPRTQGHPACIAVLNDGKMVCTFSGRRTTDFTASSGVYLYDPANNSWSDLSDAQNMYYWVKDIIIDPADASQDTWYVCVFTGWGNNAGGNKGGLYRTTNRGQTWSKLTGTQFDRVTSVTFNPLNNNQAYLTTETQGLWRSNDMNAATPTWTLVTNYNFRQPERVYFNPYNPYELWVTSFGNGMKVAQIPNSITTVNGAARTLLTVFPNPAERSVYVRTGNAETGSQLQVYDATGRLVYRVLPEKDGLLEINTSHWCAGMYFVTFGNAQARFVKQ
ncbi:MAG: T9SS type A sorting domain-containing protein [Flavipsychrobacter sp.]|nr:T9SS type A sorting domain-containing protein [Flavipsychrobacter sp.]